MSMVINIFSDSERRRALRGKKISRRNFIRQSSIISAALVTACSELKYLTGSYTDYSDEADNFGKSVLTAFVTTVIPGADENFRCLTNIFYDEYYSFKPFCSFFISDLCGKSKDLFNEENFCNLREDQKEYIIDKGLMGDSMIRKLYTAAVFMAQVSYFSGIYDDDAGCSIIDFPGTNTGYLPEDTFYANPHIHLAAEATNSGNYI